MKICGFQKTTLLDYPNKVACTVFTGGCNFKCPYCHNASLVVNQQFEEVISEEAFFKFLDKRKGVLDGVCITGGEPLIHKELEVFIHKIKEKGYLVKLDTNGSYPEQLEALIQKQLLDYVAMDVKNSPTTYKKAIGIELELSRIQKSIQILMAEKVDYEFRTTLVKGIHTLNDIQEIGKWISGTPKYYIQNFQDSGEILGKAQDVVFPYGSFTRDEMTNFINKIRENVPNAEIRGE